MNKTVFTILFFITSVVTFSQKGFSSSNNPFDSLLIDGEAPFLYDKSGDECEIKVEWVVGTIDGQVEEEKIVTICGQKDTGKVKVNRDLKLGDELAPGQTIETNGYSAMNLVLPDGSYFKIGPKSKFTIPDEICNGQRPNFHPNAMKLMIGKFFSDIAKGLGLSSDFEIETERCADGHRGTKYSVEVTDTADIVRVYEGSVEVKPKHFSTGAQDELKKLTDDLHNGKITAQEYMDKAKGLSEKMTKDAKKVSSPLIVGAGQQITVSNADIGDIVPISSDDDRWWEKLGK